MRLENDVWQCYQNLRNGIKMDGLVYLSVTIIVLIMMALMAGILYFSWGLYQHYTNRELTFLLSYILLLIKTIVSTIEYFNDDSTAELVYNFTVFLLTIYQLIVMAEYLLLIRPIATFITVFRIRALQIIGVSVFILSYGIRLVPLVYKRDNNVLEKVTSIKSSMSAMGLL
jgi:hypothetical protein